MQSLPPYGFEPSLNETLDDPIVQQLMISDGVSRADVLNLMSHARPSTVPEDWMPGNMPEGVLPH